MRSAELAKFPHSDPVYRDLANGHIYQCLGDSTNYREFAEDSQRHLVQRILSGGGSGYLRWVNKP